jgi:hypothetical protein
MLPGQLLLQEAGLPPDRRRRDQGSPHLLLQLI